MTLLVVALLGGVGAATRFVTDGLIRDRWSDPLPVATISINITGSALIGLLFGAQAYHGLGPLWFAAGAAGFCGGFTTFSTAMVETVRLIQGGDVRRAVVNAVGSLLACLAAASLGVAVMAVTG